MNRNPYLVEIERRYDLDDLDDLSPGALATLATAHEIRELNRLTAAHETREMNRLTTERNAPLRVVANVQAPISPEDLGARVMSVPDDSEGDARIAAAARRWAEAYPYRNSPWSGANYRLACAELSRAVRQEDER